MAANVKLYLEEACITELEKFESGDYDLPLGPQFGLDGDAGDRADLMLYVKNVGDQPAVSTRLNKYTDPESRVLLIVNNEEHAGAEVLLGDIFPAAIVPVMVRVSIPKGSEPGNYFPDFEVRYKTMP